MMPGLDVPHDLERLAIDDENPLAAADIEELLSRVGRQGQVASKRRVVLTSCFTNLPSFVNICTRRYSRSAT